MVVPGIPLLLLPTPLSFPRLGPSSLHPFQEKPTSLWRPAFPKALFPREKLEDDARVGAVFFALFCETRVPSSRLPFPGSRRRGGSGGSGPALGASA